MLDNLETPFLDGEVALDRERRQADITAPSSGRPQVVVVGVQDVPVADGEYVFYQGTIAERGSLAQNGLAACSKIDLARPFVFEVRDRVCAIRSGAFFNPDDPRLEYGGTWFDWTLVRDGVSPETRFWPHYKKEMDQELRTGVDCFMQHEHITRRPIQAAKPVLLQHGKVVIRATPARVRLGPLVRYTDHERAVIWLETVTPAMVKVQYRIAGAPTPWVRYGSTVRVGGRHFAAVEIDRLAEDTFHEYTVVLAPLPGSGAIPTAQAEFTGTFPTPTPAVLASMTQQFSVPSLTGTPWMSFRTLCRRYDKQLRFATGSCRFYPGDRPYKEVAWEPDMLEGLGTWLRAAPKDKWPHFLFFGGDQVYADEIGLSHDAKLIAARFAARVPGPIDAVPLRDKLVDGAWAGRFAHRFLAYKDPDPKFAVTIANGLAKLDGLRKSYPDLTAIYSHYPDVERKKALQTRLTTLTNKRKLGGAHSMADDERKAAEVVKALEVVEPLEIQYEPFRALRRHWDAGGRAPWRNPMSANYLIHNFALWSLPDFERDLPTVQEQAGSILARQPGAGGHPSVERGVHTADFAEYAYLYQRAWTSSPTVRMLLAHIPTFLMFDDHEVTDDWNFDVTWVRMLHNPRDEYRMWPKTLTDALAAYWVYQGWGNKAPSQWNASDPRVDALTTARRTGSDALPQLRRCIHTACFPPPSKDPAASHQSGLSLDWHYRLPFDPPFLVPDCRSRRLMVPADDRLREIDHETPSKQPHAQTIDDRQIAWMRSILVDRAVLSPVVFIAPSTPLLLQKKFMTFMRTPEVAAGSWSRGTDVAAFLSVLSDSKALGVATDAVLRTFRRAKDLEHMIRDKSWRDLWSIVQDMRAKASAVKTVVLVSGDVHHSYSMTASLSNQGRPRPELLQITSSGLQTTIRKDFKSSLAEELSSVTFDVGSRRMVPGFVLKGGTGTPDLALYENAVALVDVTMGAEVDVMVTYLTGHAKVARQQTRHIFKYTSGAAYMTGGEPTVVANYRLGKK